MAIRAFYRLVPMFRMIGILNIYDFLVFEVIFLEGWVSVG
jgi:hypothetical protein